MANLIERDGHHANTPIQDDGKRGEEVGDANNQHRLQRTPMRIAGGATDEVDRIERYIREVGVRQSEFDDRLAKNPRLRRRIGF